MSGYYERLSVPRNSVKIFFKYLLFTCRKKGFEDMHIEMNKLDGNSVDFRDSDVPITIVLHFRRI